MHRNINIIYALSFLRHSWFWLGTWVFYYLLFTDYSGIGLAETIMIATYFIMEIPSGALSDLLGKKIMLTCAFVLIALGEIGMAIAPSFGFLLIAVLISSVGGSFNSGTQEALAYDTLNEYGKTDIYDSVVSNMQTFRLLGMAIPGALGGFLYAVSPGIPFIATGIAASIGIVLTFFLKEPHVDNKNTFSLGGFMHQTKQGIKQLFKTSSVAHASILLISISFFTVIVYEVLNDLLAVEFGFSPKQVGILWAVITVISAGISQITPRIMKIANSSILILLLGGVMAVSLAVSPFIGMLLGGITLLIRISAQVVFENVSSVIINEHTESQYRATTISTFNLLKSVPYVILAYGIGYIMDVVSAQVFALYISIPLLITIGMYYAFIRRHNE